MYVVMDIIKSTMLWRHYEDEMREVFCAQWKAIYDWICDMRGVYTVHVLGQYGDEWHICVENITVENLEQYVNDLRESIFEVDSKYFSNCAFRIGYGNTLNIALDEYPMKTDLITIGRKSRRSFDVDKISNNIDQRENSIDVKVNQQTTLQDIFQYVKTQQFACIKKSGVYYTFSNVYIECEAHVKTRTFTDGNKMISYITYDLLENKKLKKALKSCLIDKHRIVTYAGEAYSIIINDPKYEDAFLCKNDLYGDLVNSCAKSFLQILQFEQDDIIIFHDHMRDRVTVDAYNWNTI